MEVSRRESLRMGNSAASAASESRDRHRPSDRPRRARRGTRRRCGRYRAEPADDLHVRRYRTGGRALVSRAAPPAKCNGEVASLPTVRLRENANGLRDALANIQNATLPVVIEIDDSFVHDLDLSTVPGIHRETANTQSCPEPQPDHPRIQRTRPIIRLASRCVSVPPTLCGSTPAEQASSMP